MFKNLSLKNYLKIIKFKNCRGYYARKIIKIKRRNFKTAGKC